MKRYTVDGQTLSQLQADVLATLMTNPRYGAAHSALAPMFGSRVWQTMNSLWGQGFVYRHYSIPHGCYDYRIAARGRRWLRNGGFLVTDA